MKLRLALAFLPSCLLFLPSAETAPGLVYVMLGNPTQRFIDAEEDFR